MNTRPDAVYNLTRRKLLNDKLTVTDCASQPLKLLNLVVNGLGLDSESALWLLPLNGVPGLPRVFPFDLLYLDQDYRVLETAEVAPGIEFPAYKLGVASALVVPQHTLNLTGTKPGDRLMICPVNQLEALLMEAGVHVTVNQTPAPATPVSPSPIRSQSPTPGVPEAVLRSDKTPSANAHDKAAIDRNEVRRFLFERVDRTESESGRPSQTELAAQSQAPSIDSNSQTSSGQTIKLAQKGETRVPQRAVTPRPLRSTTTFATSSLPMWHVSEPTALAHVSNPIQDPKSTVSGVASKTKEISQSKGDGFYLGVARTPERDTSVSSPSAPTNGSLRSDTIEPDRQATRDLITFQHNQATQSDPNKTDRAPIDGKTVTRNSLRSKFRQWFNPVALPSDRRRAERRYVPGMIAHYFNGGAPKPHAIADISLSGFYLLTEDRWMPGTMIQMTMQRPSRGGERRQSITVLSRIVRRGSDGVGAEFVTPESIDSHSHDIQPSQATDRLALARFL